MNLKQIFKELDDWVVTVGNGEYIPADMVLPLENFQVLPLFGMQQVKTEMYELSQLIIDQPWFSSDATALEIGLGHYGSTHILWRKLFKKITTIEKNHDRVNRFSFNTTQFYKKWILGDNKSSFIIGSSHDAVSVEKVYNSCDQIDFLFIDGDHSYKSALTDWLVYSPLVKPGGMVVFNDPLLRDENGGVGRLMDELKSGKFGKEYIIREIKHSISVGHSYYINE